MITLALSRRVGCFKVAKCNSSQFRWSVAADSRSLHPARSRRQLAVSIWRITGDNADRSGRASVRARGREPVSARRGARAHPARRRVQNLPLVMPVALLLGIVLALGRLYHDSEMTAAQACGAGSRIRDGAGASASRALLTALLAYVSLQVAPAAAAACSNCSSEALRAGQFAPISAGKFSTFGGGSTVVYAQRRTRMARCAACSCSASRGDQLEIALAQRATQHYSEGGDHAGHHAVSTANVMRGFRVSADSASCASPRTPFPCACRRCRTASWRWSGVPTARAAGIRTSRHQRAELHWRLRVADHGGGHGADRRAARAPASAPGALRARGVRHPHLLRLHQARSSPGRCGWCAARRPSG